MGTVQPEENKHNGMLYNHFSIPIPKPGRQTSEAIVLQKPIDLVKRLPGSSMCIDIMPVLRHDEHVRLRAVCCGIQRWHHFRELIVWERTIAQAERVVKLTSDHIHGACVSSCRLQYGSDGEFFAKGVGILAVDLVLEDFGWVSSSCALLGGRITWRGTPTGRIEERISEERLLDGNRVIVD